MPIDDEKPPRQQSNAPLPITPLRMGGFRPPAETPKPPIPLPYAPTPPDGFVAFAKIESRIQAECEAWGCKLDWRTFPQPAEEQLSRLIGDALAAGQFQAVVIANTNGKLYWAPAETWRISAHFKYRTVSAVFAGLMAETIMTPILGRKLECYPLLAVHDLAVLLQAERPPPPVQAVLDRIANPDLPPQREPPQTPLKRKGGRNTTHDWDAFWVEVACWSAANDLFPAKAQRASLKKHMLIWVSGLDPVPDDTTVDKKLTLLFSEVDRRT